jgi:hypothetical protein
MTVREGTAADTPEIAALTHAATCIVSANIGSAGAAHENAL